MRWLPLLLLLACGGPRPRASVDAGPPDTGVPPEPEDVRHVLWVVKNSNSMFAADPDRKRSGLVRDGITAIARDGEEHALLVYSDAFTEAPFTTDPTNDVAFGAALDRLRAEENLGALEGALLRTEEMLAASIVPGDHRWHVVLITDGLPTPTCTSGNDISPLCDNARSMWFMFGTDGADPNNFKGLNVDTVNDAYNRREDIPIRVEALRAIDPRITVHAVLRYDEALVGEPLEASLGLDRTECATFVEQLATSGGGSAETMDHAVIDWSAFLGP